MENSKYFIATIVSTLFVFASLCMYMFGTFNFSDASTLMGNDYKAYYINSTKATTSAITLKTSSGSVGSVVITQGSNTTGYPHLILYDATSTEATTSATVLAKFGTTTGETVGTYQFDVEFTKGLKLEVPVGFTGNYTVTYR